MLNGFFSNWSKPFEVRHKNERYFIDDFEILTTILSALKWKESNGNIKMVTDEVCANYYRYLGIDDIWDSGMEVILDNINKDIDPNIFWAAGKIFALLKQNTPAVMIDTDLIVWKSIEQLVRTKELCVIHKEEINDDVYPNKDFFMFKDNFVLNEFFDWNEKPCNTALLYISDYELKNFYCNNAIEFMENVIISNDRIKYMVFAEQRLISMSAKLKGVPIQELIPINILFGKKQDFFTHVWGYKDVMRKNNKQRIDFCVKCLKRILKDFPQEEERIAKIKEINKYYKLVCQER